MRGPGTGPTPCHNGLRLLSDRFISSALHKNLPMNTSVANPVDTAHALGAHAKAASSAMACASAADKNRALLALAALLRENTEALQLDNAKDLDRALAAGLAAPLVDRLRLTPKVLETCAQGCEQLAAMPEIIGEISGYCHLPTIY